MTKYRCVDVEGFDYAQVDAESKEKAGAACKAIADKNFMKHGGVRELKDGAKLNEKPEAEKK